MLYFKTITLLFALFSCFVFGQKKETIPKCFQEIMDTDPTAKALYRVDVEGERLFMLEHKQKIATPDRSSQAYKDINCETKARLSYGYGGLMKGSKKGVVTDTLWIRDFNLLSDRDFYQVIDAPKKINPLGLSKQNIVKVSSKNGLQKYNKKGDLLQTFKISALDRYTVDLNSNKILKQQILNAHFLKIDNSYWFFVDNNLGYAKLIKTDKNAKTLSNVIYDLKFQNSN
ncbi:hypothetical protein [Soonwooa sp.]|uniref:hypothetical protein n=1 Tax=Soonwooa sp. TaxID=1938592 RepID=UPI00261D39FB|nr:hypothetical protein [Soonwooa sp.]